MVRAQEDETDNEGYGSLVYWDEDRGGWLTGSDLPPIARCPWCGEAAGRSEAKAAS